MKLIDANIVIYAVGLPHEYRDSSSRVMELIRFGAIEGGLSTEVLQEVINYFHRKGRTKYALDVSRDLIGFFPALLPVDRRTVEMASTTLESYPHLQTRDAFHAATVFQHDLEGIISADRAFDTIEGLTRFDPKELAA